MSTSTVPSNQTTTGTKNLDGTRVCGIAGGSGAGKTTLTRALVETLAQEGRIATVLPFDNYYRDLADRPYPERTQVNFDHPDSLEHELYLEHLAQLLNGQSVEVPIYDFSTHTRSPQVLVVEPHEIIITEGILLFAVAEVRQQLEFKVFVAAPQNLRYQRRLKRDVEERGRTPESIQKQFATTVAPMHDQFVEPFAAQADVVVEGVGAMKKAVDQIVAQLAPKDVTPPI